MGLLLILCAIVLPPLAVFLVNGFDSVFVLNVVLTILGYIPGMVHALFVVLA